MSLSVDSLSVDVTRVQQLRSVFWSMGKVIDAAQQDDAVSRALLFELASLAGVGVSLADAAIAAAEPED